MYIPPADPAAVAVDVASYLSKPIEALWHAFDAGRATADDFFGVGRPHDPHLWAHLARYQAVQTLKSSTHEGYEIRYPHHSGIEVVQTSVRVKVCKTIDGGPQSPGRNRARRAFFQQLGLFWPGAEALNLILHWRVGAEGLELGLCKPKGVWRFRTQPKLEWNIPIDFDPIAGLTFVGDHAADVDVERIRFDAEDLGFGTES